MKAIVNKAGFAKSINIPESMLHILQQNPDTFQKILAAYSFKRLRVKIKKYDGV